ncbi:MULTISPECIES: hypothetical protein [Microbacterium]|uniref:baeRF11 domain-containing protein n=1 Tax=Microbacterium TaxID=33882 RepID=UPI002785D3CF|nr:MULTISPECIES: hypothetical protein [Microbacterium]MDQ1084531.1 hypothetical protein [Microbacterium sp. SORGH_AS_0344]MDQ1170191.1 hypothetical protein [Microbacterium proteolyticum]
MIPADLPDDTALLELLDHRGPASVSVALPSSPVPAQQDPVRTALRSAADDASRQLEQSGADAPTIARIVDGIRSLFDDLEFWEHQDRGLLLLSTPARRHVFRLPFAPRTSVRVNERFAAGPLLRARGAEGGAYVLQLARDHVRLVHVQGDHLRPIPLRLPDDLDLVFAHADNDGRADRERARGSDGDRPERERYAKAVSEEVKRVASPHVPLILATTAELDPAYRAQNTHPGLRAHGITAHPQSLDDATLINAVAGFVANDRRAAVSAWKERFGTLRAEGLATSRLSEVAAAAAAAAVEELRLDQDAERSGEIDTYGRVNPTDDADLLLDLAAAVLRTGGRVVAVPRGELTDGSPVAAELRFPVPVPR